MMKIFLLTVVLTCGSWVAFAQYSLRGQVSDGGTFLAGVNVVLFRDSAVVDAVHTDSAGRYVLRRIPGGGYRIACSRVGYEPFVSSIVVSGHKPDIEVPVVLMNEYVFELEAVDISAAKMAVDQQIDRLVIRPGETLTYSGNSILEVLQKTSGVMINRQSNTIAVGGRPGARILLNGKAVAADVALQMLDGMSAAQVERIELIAVPSSAYDAEGVAGVINIITRTDDLGTNGSANVTVGARWAEALGFAANVTRRTSRFAYYLDYSVLRNHNRHFMQMARATQVGDATMTSTDESPRENVTTQQNLNAGIEWRPGKRWMVDLQVSGYRRDWGLTAVAINQTVFNDSLRQTVLKATESNVWSSATGSLGMQVQLNARRRIEATVDYLYYHNHNPSHYTGSMAGADEIDLSKETPIRFVVGTAQYVSADHAAAFSWDAGIKVSHASFDNDVKVLRLSDGVWATDSRFTARSAMQERILAAYIATVWKAGVNWEGAAGLRYEHTRTLIDTGEATRLVRQYGSFFPQISLRRHLAGGDEFYVGYTRRITRPTYNDIAPYVFFWSADSFSSGNTFLLPALANNVTAGFRRGPWGWVASYSATKNAIAPMQPENAEGAVLVLRARNLGTLNTWSVSASYSAPLFDWWEVRSDVVVQYQRATVTGQPTPVDRALWGVNANIHNAFHLPRRFSVEVSGLFQSRTLSGIADFLPNGSLDVAVARRVGKQGLLKLAVDDLLYTNKWRIRTNSPPNNLDVRFDYDWHNRFVRLAYTWTVGNAKVRTVKTQRADEERQRVNP